MHHPDVVTSGSDDRVGGAAALTIFAFLPTVEVHFLVQLSAGLVVHRTVGRHGDREPRVMDATVWPFRVTGVFELCAAGNDGFRVHLGHGHGRGRRPTVALIWSPCFDLAGQQGVAAAVQAVTEVVELVGSKHAVTGFPRGGIENEPASKIESISGGIERRAVVREDSFLVRTRIAGAGVNRNLQFMDDVLVVPAQRQIDVLVHVALFQERQDPTVHSPRSIVAGRVNAEINNRRGWKSFVGTLVVVARESNLLEVVATLHAASSLAGGLNGGKKQTHQDSNDRNDDQEFDQSKCRASLVHELQFFRGVRPVQRSRATEIG